MVYNRYCKFYIPEIIKTLQEIPRRATKTFGTCDQLIIKNIAHQNEIRSDLVSHGVIKGEDAARRTSSKDI